MKLTKSQEERAKALHETCLVFDIHSDIQCEVIRRRSLELTPAEVFKPLRKGGVDAIWFSTPPHLMHYPSYRGDYIQAGMNCMDVTLVELEECRDHFLLATQTKDILEAKKKGKIAVFLGFEGGDPVGENLGNLRNFYRLGLREIQLTWNYKNQVCDGIYERRNAGLTEFGKELIKEMNRLGILIDTLHINGQGLEMPKFLTAHLYVPYLEGFGGPSPKYLIIKPGVEERRGHWRLLPSAICGSQTADRGACPRSPGPLC
jgi:hypothetical protein